MKKVCCDVCKEEIMGGVIYQADFPDYPALKGKVLNELCGSCARHMYGFELVYLAREHVMRQKHGERRMTENNVTELAGRRNSA